MLAGIESASYTPDRLIAGAYPIETRKVTLVSGQNLVRGAVLGKITSGGKYTLSLSASSDGSQVPDAVLVDTTDASGGDKEVMVYTRGEFNEAALTIGTGHTADSIREGLRVKNIHLKKTVAF